MYKEPPKKKEGGESQKAFRRDNWIEGLKGGSGGGGSGLPNQRGRNELEGSTDPWKIPVFL